jgi:hypothetical protein
MRKQEITASDQRTALKQQGGDSMRFFGLQ